MIQTTASVFALLAISAFAAVPTNRYGRPYALDHLRRQSSTPKAASSCKVYPGDASWPSAADWARLDNATGHSLVKTVPLAAACHSSWPEYGENRCAEIERTWYDSDLHANDPTSIMSPLYSGLTCLTVSKANASSSCTLGGYPVYVVNATRPAQVQAAVNFAREKNIRVVIKNTGHDFNGKSTGGGALSVWTHHFKDIQFVTYNSTRYQGAAIKAGSGVQARELYAAAKRFGHTVVGGEGETVGVTGGYIQGGGHSPLSSIYGMAADQLLEYEVVTADGRFLTANEQTNSDLFWALSGGGGATYGVVISATIRAHPIIPVTVSKFTFGTSPNVSAEAFWTGVRAYFDCFPDNADAGTYSYFDIFPFNDTSFFFNMAPFFAPNKTVAETEALLAPFINKLRELHIPIKQNISRFEDFHSAWSFGFPKEFIGSYNGVSGSRLFPRRNWENEDLRDQTFDAIRETIESGHFLIAFNMKNDAPFPTDNAVNPAWRESLMHAQAGVTVDPLGVAGADAVNDVWDKFTYETMQRWRDLSPGAGAYMNEADAHEPDFQQSFYGDNYEQLLELKRKWDPQGVFYAPTAVGSEFWHVQSALGVEGVQDGRLCRRARA